MASAGSSFYTWRSSDLDSDPTWRGQSSTSQSVGDSDDRSAPSSELHLPHASSSSQDRTPTVTHLPPTLAICFTVLLPSGDYVYVSAEPEANIGEILYDVVYKSDFGLPQTCHYFTLNGKWLDPFLSIIDNGVATGNVLVLSKLPERGTISEPSQLPSSTLQHPVVPPAGPDPSVESSDCPGDDLDPDTLRVLQALEEAHTHGISLDEHALMMIRAGADFGDLGLVHTTLEEE